MLRPRPAHATEPLLAVHAGGRCLAIPIGLVRRVDPLPALTRIPRAPDGVAGITEIRGRVVTVLDGGAWLADASSGSNDATPPTGFVPGVAVRLAGSFGHLALAVPATARIEIAGTLPESATRLTEDAIGRLAGAVSAGNEGGPRA